MQSDEEDFEETLETLTPARETQDPEDRFSLRRTAARVESEKKKEKMDSTRKNLFEKLTPRSEETTGAAAFSSGISSTFENLETVMPKSAMPILGHNYSPREKADRIQELEHEEARAEREFPNPLSEFCGTDDREEELKIDIPFAKGETHEEETHIENCIAVNNLKSKRAAIYGTITKGEKTLMKKIQRSDQNEWPVIQARTRESFAILTRIKENLQLIGFEKTPGEDAKYLNYSSRLKRMIAKVDHIIDTLQENIPGMVETLLEQYVQEEVDFCESLTNQTTRTSRSGYHRDTLFEQDDDKRRKDAEDHKQKMFDLTNKLQIIKKTSAGASNAPVGLTMRPDPNRTQQGANAQAGPHQNAYANAGPQFMGQPPPFRQNQPPPGPPYVPPPQQNFGAQAAAGFQGFQMMPQPNYQGIPKIKVTPFDGSQFEYQRFKLSFHAAYDDRHLPPKHLALLLESSLKGKPLTTISEYMRTCIDELSYDRMWELLEERYGGKNVEDGFTTSMFKNALPIKNGSLKEVERLYDVFNIQYNYYQQNDPLSLDMERSLLFQFGKEKLNTEFSMKFIRFTDKYNCTPNFTALTQFMRTEYLFAQTREREYCGTIASNPGGNIASVKKAFEEFVIDEDARALCSEWNEVATESVDPRDEYVFYAKNVQTGQRYEARGFPRGRSYPDKNYPEQIQKAIGFQGARPVGRARPPPAVSQFKEGQCSCCRQRHLLPDCPKFKNLTVGQQSTIIRRDKLCYHCLESPHFTRECKKNEGKLCGIDGCQLYHHRVLHRDPKSSKFVGYQIDEEMEPATPTQEELKEVETENSYKICQNGAISIQTLICNVLSGKTKRAAQVKTVVLIDSGSSVTCIDEDFALENNFRVLGRRPGMNLHMLERIVQLPGEQLHVEFQLSSVDQSCTKNVSGWTVKNLAEHTSVVDWSEQKKQFNHLKDIEFPKMPEDSTIKIIMGVDNTAFFTPVETIRNPDNETDPTAIRLSLGWTCVGRSSPSPEKDEEEDVFTNVVFKPKN